MLDRHFTIAAALFAMTCQVSYCLRSELVLSVFCRLCQPCLEVDPGILYTCPSWHLIEFFLWVGML